MYPARPFRLFRTALLRDAVLSPQPPACVIVLGEPCDYYAVGTGWEPYVIPDASGVGHFPD